MKKNLLLGALAVIAITASAQMKNRLPALLPENPAEYSTEMVEATGVYEEMAAPGYVAPRRADVSPEAFYYRPAGAYYGTFITTEGETTLNVYYSPAVWAWPFRTATFKNATANLGSGKSTWDFQLYSREAAANVWYTETTEDLALPLGYGREIDTVPGLTVQNNAGSSFYRLQGGKLNTEKNAVEEWHPSMVFGRMDYETAYSNTAGKTMWQQPKYWASATDRYGTKLTGTYYMTGAADSTGGTTGKWLGRNWASIDAIATAFEAPEHPYVLRRVAVRYYNLTYTGEDPLTLTVQVYRIDGLVPYEDTETKTIEPGELIGEGSVTLTAEEVPAVKNGFMKFNLISIDEDGIESEVTPEIDFPILVVFTGYNIDGVGADFTCTRSSDVYDDGHGDPAYLGRFEDGKIVYRPCHTFFSSAPKYCWSIFADILRPYLVYNYSNEDGKFEFPVEGGAYHKTFGTAEFDAIELYSYASADEYMEMTLADGSAIPEWLHLEMTDEMEADEWTGIVKVSATADALPEGQTYREAVVRFHFPGAYVDYTFTQGTKGDEPDPIKGDVNGDGKVEIDDVNDLINILLGKAEATAAANVDGVGGVDVQDVNVLINIILGK